jgi:hypothetical protein
MVQKKFAELIYISLAEDNLTPNDIKAILETARANNAKNNITGLLCFDGNRFLQIIEGPKQNIKDLYLEIAQDKRHDHIELIHFEDIEDLSFTRWQMAFKGVPKNLLAILSDHSSLLNFSEARGALENTNFSFAAGLFSMIMDSAYQQEQQPEFTEEPEWYKLSF